MSNSRHIELKDLADFHKDNNHVSSKTRKKIVDAIGLDLSALAAQQKDKYTLEQLNRAVRFYLVTNNLPQYIIRSNDPLDPFAIPDGKTWFWLAPKESDLLRDCGHADGALLVCAFATSVVIFCASTGYNTYQVISNEGTNTSKALKVAAIGSIGLISASLTAFLFTQVCDINDRYDWAFVLLASLFAGSAASCIASSIILNECTNQAENVLKTPPSPELLEDLACVLNILKDEHCDESDKLEDYRNFARDVIRLYVQQIAKSPVLVANINTEESASLLRYETSSPRLAKNPMILLAASQAAAADVTELETDGAYRMRNAI